MKKAKINLKPAYQKVYNKGIDNSSFYGMLEKKSVDSNIVDIGTIEIDGKTLKIFVRGKSTVSDHQGNKFSLEELEMIILDNKFHTDVNVDELSYFWVESEVSVNNVFYSIDHIVTYYSNILEGKLEEERLFFAS